MKFTNYNFFGYTLSKFEHDRGEQSQGRKLSNDGTYVIYRQYSPDITKESYNPLVFNDIILVTDGHLVTTEVSTLTRHDRLPGFCTLDEGYVLGLCFDEYVEPTTMFSITPNTNLNNVPVMPNVSTLRWMNEDVIQAPVKFFLAKGSFRKNGVVYSDVGSYSVTSGSITAASDCLGFILNG